MLNQIRKMVAAAVAVTRGVWPQGLLEVSLARHARVVTPIAPASTLYLADAEFMPFRTKRMGREEQAPEVEVEGSILDLANFTTFDRRRFRG